MFQQQQHNLGHLGLFFNRQVSDLYPEEFERAIHPELLMVAPLSRVLAVYERLQRATFVGIDGETYFIPHDNPHSHCVMRAIYCGEFLRRCKIQYAHLVIVAGRKQHLLFESDLFLFDGTPAARFKWHVALLVRIADGREPFYVLDPTFFDRPVRLSDYIAYLCPEGNILQQPFSYLQHLWQKDVQDPQRSFYTSAPASLLPKSYPQNPHRNQENFENQQRRMIASTKTVDRNRFVRALRQASRREPSIDPQYPLELAAQLRPEDRRTLQRMVPTDIDRFVHTCPHEGQLLRKIFLDF